MNFSDRLKHALICAAAILALTGITGIARAQAASPQFTFTLQTTTSDGKTVVPKLTWSTTPAATSCTASSGWTGTKAASGTQTLTATSVSAVYALKCDWPGVSKVALTWVAPTQNTDNTPLVDLAGYKIMYGNTGTAEAQLTTVVKVPATPSSWTSPDLTPAGDWFFGMKALNSMDLESALSNVTTKTTTAAENQSRSIALAIQFPKPPVVQ
jgi:hypothetical protein